MSYIFIILIIYLLCGKLENQIVNFRVKLEIIFSKKNNKKPGFFIDRISFSEFQTRIRKKIYFKRMHIIKAFFVKG